VDTSVWIDYLRHGDARLATLLDQVDVLAHSFVIGELALGHLLHREELMDALEKLPRLAVASDDVMRLIGRHGLHDLASVTSTRICWRRCGRCPVAVCGRRTGACRRRASAWAWRHDQAVS
jgi:hypothetical protein